MAERDAGRAWACPLQDVQACGESRKWEARAVLSHAHRIVVYMEEDAVPAGMRASWYPSWAARDSCSSCVSAQPWGARPRRTHTSFASSLAGHRIEHTGQSPMGDVMRSVMPATGEVTQRSDGACCLAMLPGWSAAMKPEHVARAASRTTMSAR